MKKTVETALMLMLVGFPIGWLLAELAKVQPHLGVLASLTVGVLCALPIKFRLSVEIRDWDEANRDQQP